MRKYKVHAARIAVAEKMVTITASGSVTTIIEKTMVINNSIALHARLGSRTAAFLRSAAAGRCP